MNLSKLNKNVADNFYRKYEHLGNCGLGVWHYGLYDKSSLISVVSYGTTCFNPNRGQLGRIANKQNINILQLARGGTKFNAPKNVPSQLIKLSLKEIRKEFGSTIIIAYSDTTWNEMGTIYQACNFHYIGLTNPGGQGNYKINGENMSGWVVRKKFGTRSIKKLKSIGVDVVKIPLNPKHRYMYINAPPLEKKFVTREVSHMILDYPKRNTLKVGSMLEIRDKSNIG